MSRPTQHRSIARRLATLAVAGAAALTTALVPTSASAWDDDELPDYGIPWGVTTALGIPGSVSALKDLADGCPAPDLPAAQDADGDQGYRMPIRIKIDDALLLAGYTPEAADHGQGIPFSSVSGLRGWVIAWVSLQAMKLTVDESDVSLCTGYSTYGLAWDGTPSAKRRMLQNAASVGDEYIPIPGSLQLFASPPKDPINQLQMRDFVASNVEAAVSGVNPDGSLEVEQSLTLSGRLASILMSTGRELFDCKVSTSVDASSRTKELRAPDGSQSYGGKPIGVPPAPNKEYLPSSPLTGAVEGGKASVGSNWFSVQVDGGHPVCASAILQAFYGFNKEGISHAFEKGARPPPANSGRPVFPVVDGLSNVGVDLTVDKIGLPKGLPEGYGFR